MSSTISLSESQTRNWEAAVEQYNRIINDNARHRVDLMNEVDLSRYSDRHNTPTATRADVLAHMFRWGGFYGLLMSGGLSKRTSALFNRLLDGRDPLPHAPPRCYKEPWYELFDHDRALECAVRVRGLSPRKRDAGQSIHIIEVNECPWECVEASPAASELLTLDTEWSQASAERRSEMEDAVVAALSGDVSLSLRFGQWENRFLLRLQAVGPLDGLANVIHEVVADAKTLFLLASPGSGFPLRWMISR